MSSFEDVNGARRKLMDALGDKSKQYIQHMKLWFQMKTTKEEFDLEARKILDPSQTHLHNEFLLQLFLKCSKQDLPEAPTVFANASKKTKRRARPSNGGFQPANVHDYVESRLTARVQEEPQRYAAQELFLPDQELIHMRLMLAAWELGLKGAEQAAAEILVIAVQHFLKNVLTSILSRRNGFRIRENRVQFGMGMPVPNPWLRNTSTFLNNRNDGSVMEVVDSGESVPVSQLAAGEMQQDIALCYAAGSDPVDKHPVSTAECFEALQVHRSIIPSVGVYAINMEKMAVQMYHPSWDDMGE